MAFSEDFYNLNDPGGFFPGNPSKKPDQPPQPDYVGAAKVQAGGSIGTALANAMMGQNNVNSPLGSQTWDQIGSSTVNIPGLGDVSIPRFRQNIALSPEQQRLYEGQTGLQENVLGQAGDKLSQPFGIDNAKELSDRAYSSMTARLDPQWQQREAAQKTQLANQGLAPGGEAYTNAMRDLNNARNDAYTQANLASNQLMPQTLSMEQQLRDLPLNELAALRSGSPVNMPQFNPGQPGSAQGPQTLAATGQQAGWEQAMYNANIQQQNAQKQGLMGLGAAGLMFLA